MEDYPQSQMAMETRFATEAACRQYLAQIRWPEGCTCTACGCRNGWPTRRRGLWMCAACGRQVSVTAGTIFQDTRTPLPLWFRAIWWVTSQKYGASALGLQRVLGLGSYRTAWTWLHKLRRAMVRPGRDRLTEKVEVDETLVGGVEPGGGRRHVGKKALVVVAAEVRGRAIGRIRMNRVADLSEMSLMTFVQNTVAPGAVVITDGFQTYRTLPELGYRHDRRVLLGSGDSAEAVLPRVHRVVSLLKRWLLGTHQGAVSCEHLDYYLDEFTFRFNRRTSHNRGKLFYRLLEQAVAVEPVPYTAMVKGIRGQPRRLQHNL